MEKKYHCIDMHKGIYDKKHCCKIAKEIIDGKKITGMSVPELAKEIYAHAYVYYNYEIAPLWIRKSRIGKSMYESAENGVDLEDGGDTLIRKIFYFLVWYMPKFRHLKK